MTVTQVDDNRQNIAPDTDDMWDGQQDLSFDLREHDEGSVANNREWKLRTSYLSTGSSSSAAISKNRHIDLFWRNQDSIPSNVGCKGRIIKEDEMQFATAKISSSTSVCSNHSLSSRSIMSHRARHSRSSGKIVYLDEESRIHPEGGIFTVCMTKPSKSSRHSLDAWLEEERHFREMAASSSNFEIGGDLFDEKEPPERTRSNPAGSKLSSWSPDWQDATRPILAAPLRTQNNAAESKAIPGSMSDKSSKSCKPFLSNEPLVSSLSIPPKSKHQEQDSHSHCKQSRGTKRIWRFFSGSGVKANRTTDHGHKEKDSITSLEDSLTGHGSDDLSPMWYRAADVLSSSPIEVVGDWTILVVTSNPPFVDTVETYHAHRSVMSHGPRSSHYFRCEFERYATARGPPGMRGAYSIIHLEPALAHVFPEMLDFVYSSSSDYGLWEHVDRSSFLALRKLGQRLGIEALEKATGPCNV
jgi:hypothetical protein